MNRDQIEKFYEIITKIEANGVDVITGYTGPQFATMIRSLIGVEIDREREACAAVADHAAEPPAGAIGRGDQLPAVDPIQRRTALEIAERIRERGRRR